MKRQFEAIRAGGGKTYVTADPTHKEFASWQGLVDIWCCQPFTFPREEILQRSKDEKTEFWCYPNHTSGENDHTVVAGGRMTYGFGLWRSGFRALVPWIFGSRSANPFNYTDGPYSDFMNRETVDGDVIPITAWEAYREGIDDHRYIYTLEQLIKKLENSSDRNAKILVKEAQRDLKFVWDAIRVQQKYKYDISWDNAEFDVYRWILARHILKLQDVAK